ncbi:sensor histidine kinase [Hydrogenophaga sp. A37]|uniref:sensor histidine kinase n=1 Tax=Hydrogenophaga sp. A37 TaxID=1945864 RepID=UPI0009856687|nr:sensor histidine kinase [Hydrogenophaga sp. A37]OOG87343.1 hypothetical protein B0E41_04095 [Hydrogenophaga sp. A37]
MNMDDTTPGKLRSTIEWVARGRYLMPVVVVVSLVAIGINETAYQHAHRTLSSGIALTDARIRSADALQALTDTDLHARSYLMSNAPQELAKYRETLQRLDSLKNDAFALVHQMDPYNTISLERVERLLADHVQGTDAWVEAYERGDKAKAVAASVSAVTRTRRDELREEFDLVLRTSASLQETARFSLYQALSLNRLAIHVLALGTALALFYFQRLLRAEDRKLARERLLLADRVKERTAELTEMATHLVNAREDERAHVARELHDEMGGLLTAMKLEFARLRRLPDMPEKATERLASVEARLNEGIAIKRRIIEHLRPSSLDQLGLVPALDMLCRDMAGVLGQPVKTDLQPVAVDRNAELTLFRVAQESLTNIGKYAQSARVQVRLIQVGPVVRLTVQDDGQGFSPARVPHGRHGLSGMRVRMESHGGRLTVLSVPGHGTTITAELPATPAASPSV